MKAYSILLLILFITLSTNSAISHPVAYPWLSKYDQSDSIKNRIPVPNTYQRISVSQNSFKYWLRHLPLKKKGSPVYLYNGKKKYNQSAHFSVIDIDVGDKNLQQCADAIIRLRAEYLYSVRDYDAIHFNFTSGHKVSFKKWIQGYRPVVRGNTVRWRKSGEKNNSSYANFRKYLNTIFMYAGTYSLSKELQSVNIHEMEIGDIFIKGGFPGHAVIVADMAVSKTSGKKLFLLAQSFMPAQDMHVLKNPANHSEPWYEADFARELQTPEWIFKKNHLKRFE